MSTTEDRLRAALRAVADSVPDGSAPPLDLASPGCGGRPRAWFLGGRGRPRNSAWLVPLAAAAAVACVLAGLIVASRVAGPDARHRPSPSQRPAAPPAYALALSQRPRFILWQLPLLRRQRIPAHTSADIVATATGRTAAVATLPGYVENVAADRRGRFYAAVLSRQDRAVRFYEIRRPASGRTAVVTLLPVPATTALITLFAVSPDGRHLAVASPLGAASPAYQRVQRLMVASTISGTERRWAAPQPAAGGRIVSLAWLDDDRTLAFSWWSSVAVPTPSAAVRLLDTAAPGTSYLRSRRRLALVNAAADFQDLAISGNGNVLAGTPFRTLPKVAGKRGSSGSLVEFTGPASRPSFVFRATGRWNSPFEYCMDPLWISESGRQIIAPCFPIHPANSPGPYQVVLFQDGHATLLRPLARVYAALFTSVSQMMVFGG